MNIPGYRIERILGRGGAATVYLAEQLSLKRKVALKVMTPAVSAEEMNRARFKKEALLIAQVSHDNIVMIHDVGEVHGMLYLAMQYVEGGNLLKRIEAGLSIEQAVNILGQVGSALQCIHDHKIVHRDVKPENILMRGDKALLSDLGIAKDLSAEKRLTAEGHYLGTAYYVSPEQASGGKVDTRSDVYSLGVVFYEMLTGRVPYAATDTFKVILQHLSSPLPVLPEAVAEYQEVISRALAKVARDRFQTVDEFVQAVKAVQSDRRADEVFLPVEPLVRKAERSQSAGSLLRRRPAASIAAAGLLAIGVAAGLPLVFGGAKHAGQNADAPAGELQTAGEAHTDGKGVFQAGASSTERAKAPQAGEPTAAEAEQLVKALRATVETELAEDLPLELSLEEQAKLLEQAELDMISSRLTQPPGNNALEKYRLVLKVNPEHRGAKKGIESIAAYYYNTARATAANGGNARARSLIEMGLSVLPDDKKLLELRDELTETPQPAP